MATFCWSPSRRSIALSTNEFSDRSSFSENAFSFSSKLENSYQSTTAKAPIASVRRPTLAMTIKRAWSPVFCHQENNVLPARVRLCEPGRDAPYIHASRVNNPPFDGNQIQGGLGEKTDRHDHRRHRSLRARDAGYSRLWRIRACPKWVKRRNTLSEQKSSAVHPITDIGDERQVANVDRHHTQAKLES